LHATLLSQIELLRGIVRLPGRRRQVEPWDEYDPAGRDRPAIPTSMKLMEKSTWPQLKLANSGQRENSTYNWTRNWRAHFRRAIRLRLLAFPPDLAGLRTDNEKTLLYQKMKAETA
jgi:hypothetical protein